MDEFKVSYDESEDILYFAKSGQEAESVELAPGVLMELDDEGKLIGVEIFRASGRFKDVIKLMERKLQAA